MSEAGEVGVEVAYVCVQTYMSAGITGREEKSSSSKEASILTNVLEWYGGLLGSGF